jgi:hypothetical protein
LATQPETTPPNYVLETLFFRIRAVFFSFFTQHGHLKINVGLVAMPKLFVSFFLPKKSRNLGWAARFKFNIGIETD